MVELLIVVAVIAIFFVALQQVTALAPYRTIIGAVLAVFILLALVRVLGFSNFGMGRWHW